jgi:hypothetical protein
MNFWVPFLSGPDSVQFNVSVIVNGRHDLLSLFVCLLVCFCWCLLYDLCSLKVHKNGWTDG